MAITPGSDVKDRKEPVPRESIMDRAGSLARSWFNWFQGQDRMLGEIVSGVNRNRANIVQLETDYQAGDAAVSSAYIAADAVVAADAASANASLYTTITSEYTAITDDISDDVTTNAAAISSEATTRASADTAIAASVTSLTAQTVGARPNLVPHPRATEDAGGSSAAVGWTSSGAASSSGGVLDFWISGQASAYFYEYWGSGYSAAGNFALSEDIYDVQAGGEYTLSMNGRRQNLDARLYILAKDSGGNFLGDNASATVQLPDTVYGDVETSYTLPSGTASVRVGIWVPGQTTTGYSDFLFNLVKFEHGGAATQFNTSAQVKIVSKALIGADGQAAASFTAEASAGGFSAMLGILAGDGSSSIGLYAEQLYLGDNTVFEDTYNTFYNTYSSYRLRWGGPFGSSGNLVFWRGPTSVALNSETPANGTFAFDTSGGIKDGNLSLSASTLNNYSDGNTNSENFSAVTVTPSGGSGSYSYSWAQVSGSTSTWSSGATTSASISVSITGAIGGNNTSTWRCTVTDTLTGKKATIDVGYTYYYF